MERQLIEELRAKIQCIAPIGIPTGIPDTGMFNAKINAKTAPARSSEEIQKAMQRIAPMGQMQKMVGRVLRIDIDKCRKIRWKRKANIAAAGDKLMTRKMRQDAFLKAYALIGTISGAAKVAHILKYKHYEWLREDPAYLARFQDAQQERNDRLEEEAIRRAIDGGSDQLLMFLLKGNMPERYKDRVWNEHTGKDGGPVEIYKHDLSQLTDGELDLLEQLLNKTDAKSTTEGTDQD